MNAACASCGAALPESARFCPSCAAPVASASLDEERKVVTVLFADVTGSTSLGERLDPERLRHVLHAWFSVAAAAIEAWGGTVEKFIGDAVVAVFGVPIVREDDADRALRAALEMLQRLPELNHRFREQHDVELAVRIGVNTGEVITPRVAGAAALLVAGDAVNVAARLEQAAEPGYVLVGNRTWETTRGAFEFGAAVDLELKGKQALVRAWPLLGARAEASRGIPGLRSSMVGRERELRQALDALDDVRSARQPQLVLVYGPAGIGKSRLLQEFVRSCASSDPPVRLLRGRCLAAGHGITYWALAEILRSVAGVSLDEPASAARAKVEDAAKRAGVEDAAAALALTAGIAMPGAPLADKRPSEVADELARAWPRFISGLAAEGPLVLAIEDLHWASDELVEMVRRIVGRATGPVLVLATARPDFAQAHPDFATADDQTTTVTLRPLSGEQSEQLVDELLATAVLPNGLRAGILQRADGNPYFVEEIIRRLIDVGALVREGDRWLATDLAVDIPLPDSISSLLTARIDGLPTDEKRVIQEASVIGRIFWAAPLRRMMEPTLDDGSIDAALGRLELRGLVTVRPTTSVAGQVEFIFKHALVRDVAFASLPRRRRAAAHAEVAAWIDDLATDGSEEFLDLLAHHYGEALLGDDADLAWEDAVEQRAAVRERGFEALVAAGTAARHRYDLKIARERHQRAIALAVDDDEAMRAYEELGDDEEAAFHAEETLAAYERATEIAQQRGEQASVARMALKTARIATRVGTFRDFPDTNKVEAIIDIGLAASTDERTRASLLVEKGANMHQMRDVIDGSDPMPLDERFVHLAEASALAERIGDTDLLIDVESGKVALYWVVGDHDGVRSALERTVRLAETSSSAATRALAYYEASIGYRDTFGDLDTSLHLAIRSYEIARVLSPHDLMHATSQVMIANYWLGRWDEVEKMLPEHLSAFGEESDRRCSSVRSGGGCRSVASGAAREAG